MHRKGHANQTGLYHDAKIGQDGMQLLKLQSSTVVLVVLQSKERPCSSSCDGLRQNETNKANKGIDVMDRCNAHNPVGNDAQSYVIPALAN